MSNELKSYKKISRESWGTRVEIPTDLQIVVGAMQRIADATEVMAKNYYQLQKDLDFYKSRYIEHRECIEKKDRQIAALKGVCTKYKNQIEKLKKAH